MTFKEKILFEIEEKQIIKTYPEYSDFPEDGRILVYSLNEVATEKVCSLFSKSRNEPRDLFDIYALITEKNLLDKHCFFFRFFTYVKTHLIDTLLKKQWEHYCLTHESHPKKPL